MNMDIPPLSTQTIGSTQMHYLDYGTDAPAVVLLHATGFLPWLWHPVAQSLADRYRVIAPAFFDHRKADPHSGGLGWLQLAQDLKALCDGLSLREIFLVGHSMGGVVATLAHGVHGLPVTRMVLIEPIFAPQALYKVQMTVARNPLASKAIKRRNHWRDRREARQDFLSKPFFQSWDARVLSLYIEYGLTERDDDGLMLTCPPEQEAALFMGTTLFDPWPVLPRITCPTLVMEGQISENRHLIDLKRISELIPQGSYIEVPEAGHLVPMEKPVETAGIIRSFLDSRNN